MTITHLSDLTPPSLERTWMTAPHATLPLVATCCADKTVRIYSLTNFRLLSTISGGHKRSVRSCAWKPLVKGESVLATGSFDATVGIWRRWDNYGRAGGERTAWISESSGFARPVGSANRESENGDGDIDAPVEENNVGEDEEDEEWRFAVLLDGHDSEVKSVSWSPSGSLLATCSRDKSIWIWEDLDDGDNNFETVAVLQEHSGDVKCVAWHPTEDCLASASYDDTIRVWREDIDDWGQVACLKGHEGTVWYIEWEGSENAPRPPLITTSLNEDTDKDSYSSLRHQWRQHHALSGPRLLSCSDDRTIRVWRREPKAESLSAASAIPNIIRPTGIDEVWQEEAVLPHAHDLAIYAVAWSKRTGLVASVGADGRINVYEERFISSPTTTLANGDSKGDDKMDTDVSAEIVSDSVRPQPATILPALRTQWTLSATMEASHGIYEVNHIAWARRADRKEADRNTNEEEVLVSTADDGTVKVWTISQ